MVTIAFGTRGIVFGFDFFHSGQPGFGSTDKILDAMNITVDKGPTLEALRQSESLMLKTAQDLKTAGVDISLVNAWEARAGHIAVLIRQIETHGGLLTDGRQ